MMRALPKKLLIVVLLLIMMVGGCQPLPSSVADPQESLPATMPSSADQLTMWVLDVGQGDGLLFKSPSGKYMLVDGGPGETADDTLAQLKKLGVTELDLLVVSHAHEDHIGALSLLLDSIAVRKVYLPTMTTTTRAYEKMLLAFRANKAQVERPRVGTAITWDNEVKLSVLGPLKEDYEELNECSLVVQVEFGKTSFLLTGDITTLAENDLLDESPLEPVTVLKVAHHGSNGSTSEQWLKRLKPSLAIISVGAGNDYGHPGVKTLGRLQASGVQVLRTDQEGTIRLVSDGSKVLVYNEKSVTPPKAPASLIANRKSKVIHQADSDHLPALNNQVNFSDMDTARKAGYQPCARCFPASER